MIKRYSWIGTVCISLILFFPVFLYSQAGSTCANPALITALPFSSGAVNTCAGGNNYTPTMACGNYYMGGNDYVYSFTPSSVLNACINISFSNTGSNRGIFIFDGCPDVGSTLCVAQALDKTSPASIQALQLTVGKTYYIIVSSAYGCAAYNLSITSTAGCTAPKPGSTCPTATVIGVLPYTTSSSTCLQGDHFNIGNTCMSYCMNGEDYVFKYTPSAFECISINLSGIAGTVGLFVTSGCPDNAKSRCMQSVLNSTSGTAISIPYVSLNANQTYYIIVSSNGSSTPCTNFTINVANVSCGPTGTYCGNPYIIPSLPFSHPGQTTCGFKQNYSSGMGCTSYYLNGEDFVYKYTPASTECVILSLSGITSYGTGIYIMTGCADDPATTCVAQAESYSPSSPPTLVTTLTGGVSYYIYISESYYCTPFSFSMVSRPLGAAGNTCSNPYMIPSLPFNVSNFTTGCFGNEYTSADACQTKFMNGEDFVFKYVCTASQNVRISLSNTNSSAGLFVLDGPPNAGGNCVAKDSSTFEGPPTICNVSLTPGTYYIIVDTDPSSRGFTFTPFDLQMQVVSPGTDCQDPFVIPSLPFTKTGMNTRCFRKDFKTTDACNSWYMNSEDFVFRYDVSTDDCIKIKLSNMDSYVGLFLIKGCPNAPGAVCSGQATCSWQCNTLTITAQVSPGTYYIVVSSSWETTAFDIAVQSANTTAPVVDFTANTNILCVGEQASFIDRSSPCVTSWNWQFPGGNPATSTSQFPIVTYNTSGRYSVTLSTSNISGSGTVTKTGYIIVK